MTKKGLMVLLGLTMTLSNMYGQSLFSARATAIGAYAPFVNDTRGFASNPAGLVGLRDWEFTTSTYLAQSEDGFVFHGLTFGKRFLDDYAVAVQYSPGSLLEFLVPSGLTVNTGDSVVSLDKKISYTEDFTFGLAHRLTGELSIGAGARIRREKVADTQYRLIPRIEIETLEYSSQTVLVDLSMTWKPTPSLIFVGTGKNVVGIQGTTLPDKLDEYRLSNERSVEGGAKMTFGGRFSVAASLSSEGFGAAGFEFTLSDQNLALRSSLYFNNSESPFTYAYGIGAGWRYGFLEVDAGFFGLVNQTRHSGRFSAEAFNAAEIKSLDLNAYTKNRLVLSVKTMFGDVRERVLQIQGIEMLSGVYPSSYELFAFRPIGKVRVRNASDKPVHAKARFFIDSYMDAATESEGIDLAPGDEQEIMFNAVLNEKVRSVNRLTIREAQVTVSTSSNDNDDWMQTRVLIHARNDWNGDVHSLRYFVTPDDPDILRYSREVLLQFKDSLASAPKEFEALTKARLLFNEFAGKLVFVGDPKQSNDYVQYPSETLAMKSGDCDDMTVCFASLLSSVGISTAFIDVVPPAHPEKSHIYMMFDTRLDPALGPMVSTNPKRYIVRENSTGQQTLWLLIETTAIAKGFDEAWSLGAQQYLEDVEINLGLIKGWVNVVDVN